MFATVNSGTVSLNSTKKQRSRHESSKERLMMLTGAATNMNASMIETHKKMPNSLLQGNYQSVNPYVFDAMSQQKQKGYNKKKSESIDLSKKKQNVSVA